AGLRGQEGIETSSHMFDPGRTHAAHPAPLCQFCIEGSVIGPDVKHERGASLDRHRRKPGCHAEMAEFIDAFARMTDSGTGTHEIDRPVVDPLCVTALGTVDHATRCGDEDLVSCHSLCRRLAHEVD